jgi:hypothetical protein
MIAFAFVPTVRAQVEDGGLISREYQLKALFLYNFASYIEWPADAFASPKAPFDIGILGPSSIDDTLNAIAAKKTIAGRKIVVSQFATVDQIGKCQVLFIPRTIPMKEQLLAIEKLKGHPVLVVGESAKFAASGGTVNFYIEANKVRFEINVAVVRQQQLKVSSKLLAMARIIPGTTGESVQR